MESLFNERLFVRTRHLEERLGNLSKQLAAQREDNAHLQKSHTEAKRKVQLLEEELKSARERCHKLTMKLSFSRRHAQKKSPRYEEDDYLESIEPMELGKQTVCFVCDRCASTIQSSQFGHMGSCKTNRSRELVPNFMGVMPAQLNSRLMKSKKTCKSNLNGSLTAHYARHTDAQQESGDLNDLCGCMKGCGDVELLLAHRLCLCDPNHNDGISTQQDQIKKHLLQNLTGDTTDHKFSKGSKPSVEFCGNLPVSDKLGSSKSPPNAKPMEQDLCDLRTLSTHGFYVRMESPSRCEAQQQEYFLNDDAANGINSVDADKYDLQSLQYVRALKTENEILKRVLLLAKKEEVEKLELELQALKQSASSASSASTVVINQSQEGHRTNINDCPAILNAGMGDNVINRWSQFDAINFLDSLHCIEDKILQKKIDILGLETDSTEASNSSHTKSYLNGDLRHLLKALARDVVFLRQENQWLKQKSPSVKSHC